MNGKVCGHLIAGELNRHHDLILVAENVCNDLNGTTVVSAGVRGDGCSFLSKQTRA